MQRSFLCAVIACISNCEAAFAANCRFNQSAGIDADHKRCVEQGIKEIRFITLNYWHATGARMHSHPVINRNIEVIEWNLMHGMGTNQDVRRAQPIIRGVANSVDPLSNEEDLVSRDENRGAAIQDSWPAMVETKGFAECR